MTPEARNALINDLAYALKREGQINWKRSDVGPEIVAKKMVERMDLCGWEIEKREQAPLHKTPGGC